MKNEHNLGGLNSMNNMNNTNNNKTNSKEINQIQPQQINKNNFCNNTNDDKSNLGKSGSKPKNCIEKISNKNQNINLTSQKNLPQFLTKNYTKKNPIHSSSNHTTKF